MESDTDLRRTVAAVLSSVWPGESFAEVPVERIPAYAMSMQTGLDADCVIVRAAGRRLVIKLYHDELPAAPDHAIAAKAMEVAADAGLSPRMIAHLPEARSIVSELAPEGWRTAMRPDFDDPEIRHRTMALVRQWHAVGRTAALRPPWEFIETVLRALDAFSTSGRPLCHLAAPEDYSALRASYDALIRIMAASPQRPVTLHGDVLASNLLLGSDGQMMLVDFDRVAVGDPQWDVAGLALAFDTPDSDLPELLDACSLPASDGDVERLRANMIVQDIGWGMWARLAHFLSPRRDIEFFKYGETRLARARGKLAVKAAERRGPVHDRRG